MKKEDRFTKEEYYVPTVTPMGLKADIVRSFFTGHDFEFSVRNNAGGEKKYSFCLSGENGQYCPADSAVSGVQVLDSTNAGFVMRKDLPKVSDDISLNVPGKIYDDEIEELAQAILHYIRKDVSKPEVKPDNPELYPTRNTIDEDLDKENAPGLVRHEGNLEKDLRSRIVGSILSQKPFVHENQSYLVRVEKGYDSVEGWSYAGVVYKLVNAIPFEVPKREDDYGYLDDEILNLVDTAYTEITGETNHDKEAEY